MKLFRTSFFLTLFKFDSTQIYCFTCFSSKHDRFPADVWSSFAMCRFVAICPRMDAPSNGTISYNYPSWFDQLFPENTIATFDCEYGYIISGSGSSTCQASGQWTEPLQTCNEGKRSTNLLQKLSSPDKVTHYFTHWSFL